MLIFCSSGLGQMFSSGVFHKFGIALKMDGLEWKASFKWIILGIPPTKRSWDLRHLWQDLILMEEDEHGEMVQRCAFLCREFS